MKRLTYLTACICVLMSISVSSLWAVWEGNAGIAAVSDFPGSGMYARSDMFPKNTIVEIQNLEKEITVRAVITGSSGIPGLVAVLSPETAAALNIRSGSVSRVRISIPSPVIERPAAGTVNSGTGNTIADPDINPAVAASTGAKKTDLESVSPSSTNLPLETVAETSTDPLVPLAIIPPETKATPLVSEVPESISDPESTKSSSSFYDEPSMESASTEPVPAETVTEKPVVEDTAVVTKEPPVTEASAPVVASIPPATETPTTPETPPVAAISPIPSSNTEKAPVVEPVSEVALVPAELNPPVPPVSPSSSVIENIPVVEGITPVASGSVETTSDDILPVPTVSPVVKESTPAKNTVAPIVSFPPETKSSDLPYITTLAKGSYYIQIATYTNVSKAQLIVDSFGKKYPVVIERSVIKDGELLKVFIGPVKKDEYGAVLERFKLLGYKDAFVKKGL